MLFNVDMHAYRFTRADILIPLMFVIQGNYNLFLFSEVFHIVS